jgi:hypothetical protein
MCKNMTRTSLFNLTYLDIDILGDTSERSSRVSSFEFIKYDCHIRGCFEGRQPDIFVLVSSFIFH